METLIIVGHGDHDENDSELNLNGIWKIGELFKKLKELLKNYSRMSPLIITAPYIYTVKTGENIASIFKDTKIYEFGELMWNGSMENTQKKFPQILEIIEVLNKSVVIIIPSSTIGTKNLLEFLCQKYLTKKQIILPTKDLWCGEFYFIDINENKIEYFDRKKISSKK